MNKVLSCMVALSLFVLHIMAQTTTPRLQSEKAHPERSLCANESRLKLRWDRRFKCLGLARWCCCKNDERKAAL